MSANGGESLPRVRAHAERPFRPNLAGKTAIVTGGSRGIGRATAIALAQCGANVVVAAKTESEDPRLPGTIHSVVREITEAGGSAMAFRLDVQSDADVEKCVAETVKRFGSVDIVVNNASALWWKPIKDTPMNRLDLMMRVNFRGSFALAKAALPHMERRGWGHVICMSPPIEETMGSLTSRVAYSVSKMGMTVVALGVAQEYKGKGIAGNALWPATVVESSAAENFQLGERKFWRTADVLADSVLCLLSQDPNVCTGKAWEDEELLRAYGVTDMSPYRCVPDFEPPTMRELAGHDPRTFERGRAVAIKGGKPVTALGQGQGQGRGKL